MALIDELGTFHSLKNNGALPLIFDWASKPTHRFLCARIRLPTWFDLEMGETAGTLKYCEIRAATLEDAQRVAGYNFVLSRDIHVEDWPEPTLEKEGLV